MKKRESDKKGDVVMSSGPFVAALLVDLLSGALRLYDVRLGRRQEGATTPARQHTLQARQRVGRALSSVAILPYCIADCLDWEG